MRLTLVILALFSVSYAQRIRFTPTEKSTVLASAQSEPAIPEQRQTMLEQLFKEAGCPVDEQKVPSVATPNITCRLKGKHNETIIVGANYGLGPPDNWKGAALLPYLYKALSHRKRHFTLLFVAFADDQKKLSGSSFFVQQMTDAQVKETLAMVNLDALGFSFTKISEQHSDPQLVKLMINAAYMFKLTASQVDLSRAIQTDSESFVARDIPRITLHSLTVGTLEELKENEQAPLGRFRPDNYYDSYRLVAGYLAYLDETLKPRRHKK